MAIFTLPAGLTVNRQTWGQRRFDLTFQGGDNGSSQSRILAPPRWMTSLFVQQEIDVVQSALWRSMILDLQGKIHQLAVYDLINTAPQGTLRGVITLSAAAAAGATTLSITAGAGQAATTLKRGDWLGIGTGATSQLVSVSADAVMNGAGAATVSIAQPIRVTQASGTGVVWDKPTALFRLVNDMSTWESKALTQGGYSLDLIESWAT